MHSLISAAEYPVFAPPLNLHAKLPRDWSKLEAETYFDWFSDVLEPRVNNLLGFLDLNMGQNEGALLSLAQERCERLLTREQFTSVLPAGRKLTNQGHALAADLGLLMARFLVIRGAGKVAWTILKRPKTDQSYNLPVLTGFGGVHLDPVAGSIGDLAWLALGNKKPAAWSKGLEFWSAKISCPAKGSQA